MIFISAQCDTKKNSMPQPRGASLFLPNTFVNSDSAACFGLRSSIHVTVILSVSASVFLCSFSGKRILNESAKCLDRVRQMASPPHTAASGINPGRGSRGAPASPQRTSHSWRTSSVCEAIRCLACLIDRTSRGGVGSYQPHFTDKKTKAWKAPPSCSGPGC